MPHSPQRRSSLWIPVLRPAAGPAAVAVYVRSHLYGGAVGQRLLRRCQHALEPADRPELAPLHAQFDEEMDVARAVLAAASPIGAPGRSIVASLSAGALRLLPAGPLLRDPLTRLALLEALRTLVVAKRSMWVLLAGADTVSVAHRARCRELVDQADEQAALLERLRLAYGRRVFG